MRTPLAFLLASCLLVACGGGQSTGASDHKPDHKNPGTDSDKPPVAAEKPFTVKSANGDRQDPYYWLRDDKRKNPEMLAYLAAENAYTSKKLAPTKAVQETLYKEIVGRIKQDDASVPTFDNGYWYYSRHEVGAQYPIHARRKQTKTAAEEVIFDVSKMAKDHNFYRLGNYAVSEDNKLVAYAEDTVGRNQYTLRVKELATGKPLADTIVAVTAGLVWHNSGKSFFYVGKEPKTLRSYRVYQHVLGTQQKDDKLVYEEKDKSYYTSIGKSKSRKKIFIYLSSTTTSETWMLDANATTIKPTVLLPRERDHEYRADHLDGRFVIRTNWQAKNFRLMEVAEASHADRSKWRDIVAHDPNSFVHGMAVYSNFVGVGVRTKGLRQILVIPKQGKRFFIDAKESAYTMYLSNTPDPKADSVRYSYSSLTTPMTQYERNIKTGKRTLLKRQPVLGNFDQNNYVTKQVMADARDGAKVAISVVHHKDTKVDGTAPAYLIAYGSYGSTVDPVFRSKIVSLLDRGFVYAILHIRGSQKFGRNWYEDGKLLNKKNTFNDFVDATKHLIAAKYASPKKVFAMGGSAGGLLMGAIVNQAPELYRGVISHVPFVDVVTTMLDESIPLTTNEFDEWGNPKVKKYYDYMLSYSPYDRVEAKAYPTLLVTTGLWDSQVQYWEPAKWVAKLRKLKTDKNPLLLHVNMKAGHGGKSGRYRRYRETARDYAFLLHTLKQADSRAR